MVSIRHYDRTLAAKKTKSWIPYFGGDIVDFQAAPWDKKQPERRAIAANTCDMDLFCSICRVSTFRNSSKSPESGKPNKNCVEKKFTYGERLGTMARGKTTRYSLEKSKLKYPAKAIGMGMEALIASSLTCSGDKVLLVVLIFTSQ